MCLMLEYSIEQQLLYRRQSGIIEVMQLQDTHYLLRDIGLREVLISSFTAAYKTMRFIMAISQFFVYLPHYQFSTILSFPVLVGTLLSPTLLLADQLFHQSLPVKVSTFSLIIFYQLSLATPPISPPTSANLICLAPDKNSCYLSF